MPPILFVLSYFLNSVKRETLDIITSTMCTLRCLILNFIDAVVSTSHRYDFSPHFQTHSSHYDERPITVAVC